MTSPKSNVLFVDIPMFSLPKQLYAVLYNRRDWVSNSEVRRKIILFSDIRMTAMTPHLPNYEKFLSFPIQLW